MFDSKLTEVRNNGVSPVIGVILMVAITVILAAVIGTFVLGLADDLDQNASAVVQFDEVEEEEVVVTLNNVQSADEIFVTSPDYDDSEIAGGEDDGTYLLTEEDGGAGTTVTVDTSDEDGGTIQVIGVLDGSENVIQTYEAA